MSRMVVIGMDGATWRVLEPLIDAGALPTLNRLRTEGAAGPLRSTVPPLTPPGWTSAVTGKNPGKHGIFDFRHYSPDDYEVHLTSRLDRHARAVWNMLGDAGRRVLVMNVPHTVPPEKVNGVLVTGFGTPGEDVDYTWPPELKQQILAAEPGFKVDLPATSIQRGDWDGFLAQLQAHTETQWRVFTRLYEQERPDFAMFVFAEMDRLMHFFWHYVDATHPAHIPSAYGDAFRSHFAHVDALLGAFLEKFPGDTNMLLFSDHGFGPVHSDIYLNNWLRDEGYLVTREASTTTVHPTRVVRVKAAIVKLLEQLGVWKYYRDYRLRGREVRTVWYLRDVDWSQTRAAVHSMSSHGIRFNIRGRERCGVVAPEDARSLADELSAKLLALCAPDGTRLFRKACYRDEVFHGPYAAKASDLLLEPAPGFAIQHGFGDALIMPSEQHGHLRSGDHEPDGIVLLHGPHIAHTVLQDAAIVDIAPTLLHLMGEPVRSGMDGKVLQGALRETGEVRFVDETDDESIAGGEQRERDDDALAQRLRDLGYL